MKISSLTYQISPHNKGVTLLEILIVVAIAAVITTMLLTVFKSGFDSWRKAESNLEIYQHARVALDMITRDLTAAYLNASDATITFRGFDSASQSGWMTVSPASIADEVFFIAALSPGLSDPGALLELCKVGYFLDSSNNLQRVYFVQTVAPPVFTFSAADYNNRSRLASNITQLNLRYWDPNGAPPGFIDTWDSTVGPQAGRLPRMVEITISVREPNPMDPANPKTEQFITNVYIPGSQL